MTNVIGWHHPTDDSDQWDGFNDSGIEHFRGNPIPHLARETNQNALDASDTGIVDVSIKLHRVQTSSIPNLDELIDNLEACLHASKNESAKAELFFGSAIKELKRDKISVLEISDHNTRGMVGPSINGTPFYAFVKAKGQSRKETDTATGSYGIGKFAPYAVSKLRTIFVSTVYQNADGDYIQLTQGKAILMSHDKDDKRKLGNGYWGKRDKCQPIEGITDELPDWLQRVNASEKLSTSKGSKVSVLCFEETKNWRELLAASVAENFFGAITDGKLRVEIDNIYTLDQESIFNFFMNSDVRNTISNLRNEPEMFDNCKNYLDAYSCTTEVYIEESEMRDLGLCQVRILLGEGLPKKVCFLRNGMFITDYLNGLKLFSDFKEFVAVFHCQSTKGNELLRAMEPPRHDDFEPDRLPTKQQQKEGARALKDIARWIREMLKRHAKDPVTEVTEIDELKDFFGDEGDEGSGKGTEEINPYGELVIRGKPIKPRTRKSTMPGDSATGGEGEGTDGGGGNDGEGGGDGQGGTGTGTGGTGGGSKNISVSINNVRAIVTGNNTRVIAFTPVNTGRIKLNVLEAGADVDYSLLITKSSTGIVENGYAVLDVTAGNRQNLNIEIDQDFTGAVKVHAYEI